MNQEKKRRIESKARCRKLPKFKENTSFDTIIEFIVKSNSTICQEKTNKQIKLNAAFDDEIVKDHFNPKKQSKIDDFCKETVRNSTNNDSLDDWFEHLKSLSLQPRTINTSETRENGDSNDQQIKNNTPKLGYRNDQHKILNTCKLNSNSGTIGKCKEVKQIEKKSTVNKEVAKRCYSTKNNYDSENYFRPKVQSKIDDFFKETKKNIPRNDSLDALFENILSLNGEPKKINKPKRHALAKVKESKVSNGCQRQQNQSKLGNINFQTKLANESMFLANFKQNTSFDTIINYIVKSYPIYNKQKQIELKSTLKEKGVATGSGDLATGFCATQSISSFKEDCKFKTQNKKDNLFKEPENQNSMNKLYKKEKNIAPNDSIKNFLVSASGEPNIKDESDRCILEKQKSKWDIKSYDENIENKKSNKAFDALGVSEELDDIFKYIASNKNKSAKEKCDTKINNSEHNTLSNDNLGNKPDFLQIQLSLEENYLKSASHLSIKNNLGSASDKNNFKLFDDTDDKNKSANKKQQLNDNIITKIDQEEENTTKENRPKKYNNKIKTNKISKTKNTIKNQRLIDKFFKVTKSVRQGSEKTYLSVTTTDPINKNSECILINSTEIKTSNDYKIDGINHNLVDIALVSSDKINDNDDLGSNLILRLNCHDETPLLGSKISGKIPETKITEVETNSTKSLLTNSIINKTTEKDLLTNCKVNSKDLLHFIENLQDIKENIEDSSITNEGSLNKSDNIQEHLLLYIPKIEEPCEHEFIESLMNPKQVDVCKSLLDHLKLQNSDIDFDLLQKSFNEKDFRIMSDGRKKNKVVTKNIPRNNFVKKSRKGKIKIYKLNKIRKNTYIEETNASEIEDVSIDNLFTQLTQQNINIADKSFKSFSTHDSFITDDAKSECLSNGSEDLTQPQKKFRSGLNNILKDKSILYESKTDDSEKGTCRKEIIQNIEDIFIEILNDFENNRKPVLKYPAQCLNNRVFANGRYQVKEDSIKMTSVSFGHKNSRRKFCLMLYLLDKVRKLLINDTKLTKREIYYQIKNHVKDQRMTDSAIMAITCLLNVGPWDLNIFAQKGLVYGNLNLKLSSGEVINCNVPGTLIPLDIKDIVKIETSTYFVLIVEKESIFHKLIAEDLPNRLTRPFILITGKGFPDYNTQLFAKKLWMVMSVPVFILVDPDPQGIQIMLNYRFGSLASSHISHQLAIPKAQWLGVFPSEIVKLNIPSQLLTEKDKKIVNQLLQTPHISDHPKIYRELQVFLQTNMKSEIEGLIKSDTYLSRIYLIEKFYKRDFF